MKLSEAIRVGATRNPQCFGQPFGWDEKTQQEGTCALGAAYVALLGYPDDWGTHAVRPVSDKLHIDMLQPLECELTPDAHTLADVIVDLNDMQQWTRDQIADWLAREGF